MYSVCLGKKGRDVLKYLYLQRQFMVQKHAVRLDYQLIP